MGAVDVIPGVSGGTIALITGIYEELIRSIRSINAGLLKLLFKKGPKAAWERVNGNFLISVVAGILISIFSLARLLSWLFDHHAMMVWAFFFGLILGSAIYIGARIRKWNAVMIVFLAAGAFTAYYITIATPSTGPDTMWYIFLSGGIAFCAMVLPGVSGAFILVLLGKYEYMLNAVSELNFSVLALFATGGVLGLIAFSNIIGWFFSRYHNATLALLTGFMAGSLNKLWPWKEVLDTRISSAGQEVPVLERGITPMRYAEIYGQDPQLLPVIGFALAGLCLILGVMAIQGNGVRNRTFS